MNDQLHHTPDRKDEYRGQQDADQDEISRPAAFEIPLPGRVLLHPEKGRHHAAQDLQEGQFLLFFSHADSLIIRHHSPVFLVCQKYRPRSVHLHLPRQR